MAEKYIIDETKSAKETLPKYNLQSKIVDDYEINNSECCMKLISSSKTPKPDDAIKAHQAIKILVLGPGNSGKTTILKQMKIIHGESYSIKERKKFKYHVIVNIIDSIIRLVHAMQHVFNMKFQNKSKNEENFNTLLAAKHILETPNNDLNDWYQNVKTYSDSIISIWKDSSIRTVYHHRNKFYLNESTQHFIQNLERVCQVDYIPEIDDLLRVRVPTTGILEYTFKLKNTYFLFVDVGGQRSERRKWINCFENITSMLYVTSLSDYDSLMSSDELKASDTNYTDKINRMKESIDLFNTIVNWKKKNYVKEPYSKHDNKLNEITIVEETFLFQDVSIILFLNKEDLFDEKIKKKSLKECFSDCNEKCSNAQAKEFIAYKFLACEKQRKDTYWHCTCALDTKNIEAVIAVVRDSILTMMAISIRLE